jgi:DNA-binding transcriptional ArsR family regulator
MSHAMPATPSLDHVFAALADPTRRAIVERLLAEGEKTVGDVAKPFHISAPAVTRHLQVLESAGLIEKRIDRQFRLVRARPEALRPVGSWFERQQRHWSDAFDRLEAVIAAETPKRRKS